MKKRCKMLTTIMVAGALSVSSVQSPSLGDTVSEIVKAAEGEQETVYKVMPLGDSITAGWCQGCPAHQFGGYRIYLNDLLEENGYSDNFDFVGKWNTGSGYDTDNNGTNGATIAKDYTWANSIQTDINNGLLEEYDPDVVLLQIGTNDINNQTDEDEQLNISTINDRLETLVDSILSRLESDDMLFIATIPYMWGGSSSHNTDVDAYNAFIETLVEEKTSEDIKVVFVDVNSVVKEDQYDDDLHPNQEGYESIGKLWYEVLSEHIISKDPNVLAKKEETIIPTPTPGEEDKTTTSGGTDTTQKENNNSSVSIRVGDVFKVKQVKYKVIDSKKGSLKVAFIKNANKKVKKVIVPKTVSYKGMTFSVTKISEKAFYKNTKLHTVTIGAKVTTVDKSAFNGCKNLKKIIIKSKAIKKVEKNAFKGIHKKCKIKVPKSKLKKYKKLLKGKGQKKTVKIIK